MSGQAKPSKDYITSSLSNTTTQASPQLLSSKNSVNIIDSKQSVIPSSLTFLDDKARGSDNINSARQILNSNFHQIELSAGANKTSILDSSNIVNVASSNNRGVDLSHTKNYLGAVDILNDSNSWKSITTNKSTILRDCSDSSSHQHENTVYPSPQSTDHHSSNVNDSLISIGDNNNQRSLKSVPTTTTTRATQSSSLFTPCNSLSNRQAGDETRAKFESLLISDSELVGGGGGNERELSLESSSSTKNFDNLRVSNLHFCDSNVGRKRNDKILGTRQESQVLLNESSTSHEHNSKEVDFGDEEEEEDELFNRLEENEQQIDKRRRKQSLRYNNDHLNDRSKSPSYFKRLRRSFNRRLLDKFNTSLVGSILTDSTELNLRSNSSSSEYTYSKYEDKDLLTGTSKYISGKRTHKLSTDRTFRGTYKYSRTRISMAIFKKAINLVVQRSTLSLFGAFLIHVTLGTVYTLSNINSYLTSYMRLHGSPNATYGGSMWISSLYAVGQGISMVLGGFIEKRFSARVACLIGCALHSISIMSTSWSVNHGPLAVLMTYGFIPGFGCGLAYMTPMSNGFGWFPNRKGLVAGVILAGFGIGTFIFNMAQTAYVNPQNLSPPDDANGYFTQETILDKVPHLFVFIGTIYASMQFIGCCFLFKPPNTHTSGLDERPILVETEMSLKRSIRRREFMVLFLVYGITTQGVLFVNSMIKEYGQIFIGNDMYLAWTGSMASIANSMGRLGWGLAIDRFSFTQCFTSITVIFGFLMFIMPFEFILSSKLLYLLCTLGIFGSFSGWMSTYPVHLSRVFGRTNSGVIYGLIFISQSLGGILTALGAHYMIDHYNRFVPFFCVVFLEIIGLAIYHLFYPK